MQATLFPNFAPPKRNTAKAKFVGANSNARREHDFYPSDPLAVNALFHNEQFPNPIWEPACGDGLICHAAHKFGYETAATDKFDHGYGLTGRDFFDYTDLPAGCRSIVTNPPYKVRQRGKIIRVEHWVAHAMTFPSLEKMALLLKTVALAGQERSTVLKSSCLARVLQFEERIAMGNKKDNMIDFAWFIFERGHSGPPTVHWITSRF